MNMNELMKSKIPQLFPFPLVEGVEGLHARHRRTGRTIYGTVVLGLLALAACLPLIEVEVNSQSRGILRPVTQLTPVSSPVSGRVTVARLRENASVAAGDTLLVVSTAELTNERKHLIEQGQERRRLLMDLRQLLSRAPGDYPSLVTELYQREYRDYRRQADELALRLAHARRHRERQDELLQTGSVARMEAEQAAHDVTLLENQRQQLEERRRAAWSQDAQRIRRERGELEQQLAQLDERAQHYVVTAPVAGELTRTEGLQAGGFVSAGQVLTQVSPAGELRVEAFVSPADIGLLREGLPVRLQLDAFNYNQWGLARATLTEIGRDVTEVDGQAAFRVLCTLQDSSLHLKNGYTGTLRKGMTLTAHFTLTRRSLFQLLHDKLDDWFNPTYH